MRYEYMPPKSLVDQLGFIAAKDLPGLLLKDGLLMKHQKAWVEDKSDLKLGEKGRRTGVTYAEAHDDVLTASSSRAAGGDNVWYIGDTKEKGREFINTCADIAKAICEELLSVEEFIFDDVQEDGKETKYINAFRITFSSGYRICALSSRPANIRGLQGIVVIDEAAFHPDVRGVIDACNALLIWGGKIRIISTHNGVKNAFNELIKETREGTYDYNIHHVTFDDAIANGLYERRQMIRGKDATVEGKIKWYNTVQRTYGSNDEARQEELAAVPREGEGTMLPLAWIEACQTKEYKVKRWSPPERHPEHGEFVDWPAKLRRRHMEKWLESEILPILEKLPAKFAYAFGEDFGMRVDRSSLVIGYTAQDLVRHIPLIIELKKCPYDQQKQALKYVVKRLPRFRAGVLDANGNGMPLAQEARQAFGRDRIQELTPNDEWYRTHSTTFRNAFENRMILLPADLDTQSDLQEFRIVGGIGKIPSNVRKVGSDGDKRHGDNGMGILYFWSATKMEIREYDYEPAPPANSHLDEDSDWEDDDRMVSGSGLGYTKGTW